MKICKRFPEVEFHIKIGSTDELELWLKENQIEVAVLLDKPWHVPEQTVNGCCVTNIR